MPLYEFECPRCAGKCEVMRPVAHRDDPMACDDCWPEPDLCHPTFMQRTISPSALHFKGPGFHVNDYPKES